MFERADTHEQSRSLVIWIAVAMAISAHLALLTKLQWQTKTDVERTLQVTLKRPVLKELSPVEPVEAMPPKEREQEPPEPSTPTPKLPNPTHGASEPDETEAPSPVDNQTLVTRSLAAARRLNLSSTKTRTFSISDLPIKDSSSKAATVTYARAPTLKAQLVGAPYRASSQNSQGYTTMLLNNGYGRTVCVQERGFKDDPHGPMWYVIPAASCGHLRKDK